MEEDNYLKSKNIGSSLLADCVVSLDPLEICTDRATKERKPTKFMGMGERFEDLVRHEYDPEFDFWEMYFLSDISEMPEYGGKNPDIKQIAEILEADNVHFEVGKALGQLELYYTKKNGELYENQKNRKRCLDQIKAHDYRRPIPKPWWSKLEIMLERFKNRPFELAGITLTMHEWMIERVDVSFQVEHFWESEGAHCRAKFDMVWSWKTEGVKYAIPFDLKCTGDEIEGRKSFGAFVGNWRKAYVLQSIHYREGFEDWRKVNGYEPFDELIYYIIQESDEPQVSHIWALHRHELEALKPAYREALPVIQKWIDDGKPVKGYTPQKAVNRYGREWREL